MICNVQSCGESKNNRIQGGFQKEVRSQFEGFELIRGGTGNQV